jgi:hypothetical protein
MTNIRSNPPLKSLTQWLNQAVQEGYKENFKVTDKSLKSLNTNKEYQTDKIQVVNFYQFEGSTDPADNSILYILKRTMAQGNQRWQAHNTGIIH